MLKLTKTALFIKCHISFAVMGVFNLNLTVPTPQYTKKKITKS